MAVRCLTYIAAFSVTACAPSIVNDIGIETGEQVECGYNIGDILCDIQLVDQHGDDWSLYDNSAKATVIDLSVMWCAPCQAAATVAEDIVNSYSDDNVQWVTILIEDSQGNAPDLDDLQAWASTYHGSSPIVAGDRSLIDISGENGFPLTSWPTFLVIDEDATIWWMLKGWSEQMIRDMIEDVLAR